jgi:hypothetical protein
MAALAQRLRDSAADEAAGTREQDTHGTRQSSQPTASAGAARYPLKACHHAQALRA